MFQDYMELAVALSTGMLKNGGETYRAEECAKNILKAGGAEQVDILAFPTGVTISAIFGGETFARVCSVKSRGTDLGNIDFYNTLSRKVCTHAQDPASALEDLKKAENAAKGFLFRALFSCLSSASFTVMLGGSLREFLITLVVSFIAQSFIALTKRFGSSGSTGFLSTMAASIFIALLANLSALLFENINLTTVITGGIIPLLPGLSMLNAIRDTLGGDLISGVARTVEALLTAIAIAAGVGVTLSFI